MSVMEKREKQFRLFKYSIYFLLFLNIFYWFREDYLAAAHTFRGGFAWSQLADVFSQAVDTIAWFALLMVFELETRVIDDKTLNKGWKWLLNAVAAACYVVILLALFGYYKKLEMVFGFTPILAADACAAMGDYLSFATRLDEYTALNAKNCISLTGTVLGNSDTGILSTQVIYTQMIWLAASDIVNAGAWILVVLLLWIDTFIQLKGLEHGPLYRVNIVCKGVLYSVLMIVCIYWGYDGKFMDFWDAFLWIFAFFFIEMNIFQWSEENHELQTLNTDQQEGAQA